MTAKDLKNALLQEAVQGKLVPQIASEGNARDLLEEIRKEKLSHGLDLRLEASLAINAKSGKRKSKKETALAGSNPCDITEEEIPFDIPESWCWCRLGEIVPFGTCKNAEPNEIEEEDWILDLEDIEKDSGKILAFKTKKQIDAKSTKHVFIKGNVLYSKLRPYLNKCVIAPKNGFCTSEILPLDFGEHIYNKYAQLYLMSPFFVDYTNSLSFGVKMPRLGTEDGKKALFPLPPLVEQKRIVAAIEKFMPLIEEYGKKETQLKAINEKIGTLTKKAILQEAVQGKLVPQIAAEGNAKDLLEEIKKEKAKLIKEGKIKKEKPLPEISDDEIPFDIPENWCWCRLGEICNLTSGQDLIPEQYNSQNKGIPYITGASNFSNENIIVNRWTEYARAIAEENDLLLTCKGTVGEMAFLHEKKVHIARQVMGLHFNKKIDSRYMKYFITTQINNLKSKAKSMIPGIARDDVIKLTVPLPPLAEQKRIVKAIENLLPLCEALKI